MTTNEAEPTRSPSLAARLFWTFVPPIALLAMAPLLTLPGINRGAIERLAGSPTVKTFVYAADGRAMTAFALGLAPVIGAYALVELIALLVPRLSRLRHGNPAGRQKLDRAAGVVALVFALGQGFSMASSLSTLLTDPLAEGLGSISVPVVTASLVAGMFVMLFVARLITRQGIVNGIVLLIALSALDEGRRALASSLADPIWRDAMSPFHAIGFAVVLVSLSAAGAVSLRPARPAPPNEREAGGAPYRHARALVLRPIVPVPASTMAPSIVASTLLTLPFLLSAPIPALKPLDEALGRLGDVEHTALYLGLTLSLAVFFARLLHRPREMAELATRLGSGTREEAVANASDALRRALPPTLAFLAIVVVASAATGRLHFRWTSAMPIVLFVAVAMDVWTATRAYAANDLAIVWQERRWSAVPVIRAILEAEGITVRTGGMSVLGLLQVFAPYASAEILVPVADAPRASALLRRLLLGEAVLRPEAAERFADATEEWKQRRIAIILDGVVNSAPVVRTRIGGGRLSITMGVGAQEKQLAEAKQLAAALSGH